jgi:hypothetical protein
MKPCLFCKTEGDFAIREHIVPESLGNDTDIIKGIICESCQNYFGREVEKPALEKTPIAFWRSYLGIRTKAKHLPSVNLDPPTKGAIPAYHPATDMEVGLTSHEDGSTEIETKSYVFRRKLLSEDRPRYQLVLSPWHLSILGRFLGKMGLEYVASIDLDYALSTQFDNIRSFVRYGSTNHLWPIYWGQQGKLEKLKGAIVWYGWEGRQEIECYRYALGKMRDDEILFAFSIGIEIMVICLTTRLLNSEIEKSIADIKLQCIFYQDGSWQ